MATQQQLGDSKESLPSHTRNAHPPALENLRSDSEETQVGQEDTLKKEPIDPVDGLESASQETLHEKQPAEVHRWTLTRVLAFLSLCFVYSASQIIVFFTSGALGYMAQTLGTTAPNWILTVNTLFAAGTLPFVGYITDLLGRRWVCIFGATLCIISSAVMGSAQSFGAAIVAQAIGGIGTGITEVTALAGVAEITPVKYRSLSFAAVNLSIVPFMPYLIYTTKLEEVSTWRWCYLIIGGWHVIGLTGIFFFYRPPPRPSAQGLTRWQIIKNIDYVGFILSFGGVAMFLVGLQAGGYQFAWSSGKVLGPLIVGAAMVAFFPFWEVKFSKNALVPSAIFRGQWVVGLSYIQGFIGGMNYFALLGFYPVMLQKLFISSPTEIGVRSLGAPFGSLVGGMVGNILMSFSKGRVRMLFFTAAVLMTAFSGALAAAKPNQVATIIAIATVDGFAIGAFLIPTIALGLYACPDRYVGTTSALALTVRYLGAAVGTTIYFNIFNSRMMEYLPQYVTAAVTPLGYPTEAIPALLAAFNAPEADLAMRLAAQVVQDNVPNAANVTEIVTAAGASSALALAKSLSYIWYVSIAFGALSIISTLFLPNIRKYMTDRVAVVLH